MEVLQKVLKVVSQRNARETPERRQRNARETHAPYYIQTRGERQYVAGAASLTHRARVALFRVFRPNQAVEQRADQNRREDNQRNQPAPAPLLNRVEQRDDPGDKVDDSGDQICYDA